MSLYLPERYQALQGDSCGIRTFDDRELEASDRIARHVQRGGLALLQGRWERILNLWERLRSKQLDPASLGRLMLRAAGDTICDVEPPPSLPYLDQVIGERAVPTETGYLVSLHDLLRGLEAMGKCHPVDALGQGLIVHDNVLVPRSQTLIRLMRRALETMRPDLPEMAIVLDMGCGSGCCTLLAAQVMPGARIFATDHLPEAAATTKINAERFAGLGLIHPEAVQVLEPGDLFDSVGNGTFDLLIFNAPWVVAPARNRAETALNDFGQETVRRFLLGAARRLRPGGRVLLGYADHSGLKAMTNLDRFITEAGLEVRSRHTDRIKTHRSKGAWQSIYAFDLHQVR